MNPRNAINFVRSPIGAFIAFCLLVVVALLVANGFRRPTQQKSASIVPSAAAAETEAGSARRRDPEKGGEETRAAAHQPFCRHAIHRAETVEQILRAFWPADSLRVGHHD